MNDLALDREDVADPVSRMFHSVELIDHDLMLRVLAQNRESNCRECPVECALQVGTCELVLRCVFHLAYETEWPIEVRQVHEWSVFSNLL